MLTSSSPGKARRVIFPRISTRKKGVGGGPPPPSPINTVAAKIQKFQHFRPGGAPPHKTLGPGGWARSSARIPRRSHVIDGGGDVSHNVPLCDKNVLRSLDEILARMMDIIWKMCRIMWSGGQWSTVMARGGAGSNFSGRWKSARWQSSGGELAHHFSKNAFSTSIALMATGGGERAERRR